MKTIVCYGDSNTWGYAPKSGERYDRNIRWPGALERMLNEGQDRGPYALIEEGLCGRTSCRDDPFEDHLNGFVPFMPVLLSHRPVHLMIIMLGTNDLKSRFHAPAYDIAKGVQRLAIAALNSAAGPGGKAPGVLMLCPPPLLECPSLVHDPVFGGSIQVSREMAPWYKALAEEAGALFFDAGLYTASSTIDGVHLEEGEHRKLALALAEFIREQKL